MMMLPSITHHDGRYLLEFETAIRTLKNDEFKCVTIP